MFTLSVQKILYYTIIGTVRRSFFWVFKRKTNGEVFLEYQSGVKGLAGFTCKPFEYAGFLLFQKQK